MFLTKSWKRSIFTTAALLALTQTGIAQPPAGPRGEGRREGPPRESLSKKEEPKKDPNIDAWAETLVSKIADRSDTIRDSARAGLVALGHAALPALKKAADGSDLPTAEAARKVIGRIEHKGHRGPGASRGPGGPKRVGPGGPGAFGPGGPRGFGPGGPGAFGPGGPRGFGPGGPGGFGPGRPEGIRSHGGPQAFGPGAFGPGGPRGFGPGGPGGMGRSGGMGPVGPGGPRAFVPSGSDRFGPGGPRGFGPGGPGGAGRPEGLSVRVMEKLKDAGLDDSQKEKVKAILENQSKAVRAVLEKAREKAISSGERPKMEAVGAELKEQKEKTVKALKEVLKPDQFEKAKDLLERGPGGPFGPGGPREAGRGRGPGGDRGPGAPSEKPRDKPFVKNRLTPIPGPKSFGIFFAFGFGSQQI